LFPREENPLIPPTEKFIPGESLATITNEGLGAFVGALVVEISIVSRGLPST
jgi:hypothetical protein